jgi:hypothetical protein
MTIEKYSCYEYKIIHCDHGQNLWSYEIYGEGCKPYFDGKIESPDCYESQQEARYAAIGHISLLENGEG